MGKYLGREIYVSLVLVLPVLLPSWFGRGYAIFLYIIMLVFTATNWVHAYLYAAPATSYLFTVVQETYAEELSNFFAQYIDAGCVWRILASIVLPLPALLLCLLRRRRSCTVALIILIGIGAIFAVKCAQKNFFTVARWHYGVDMIWSCITARNEQAAFAAEIGKHVDLPAGIRTDAKNRILVLVIGESSGRNHYSLYGYPRLTTPKLAARKDDLLIFTDVIAAHAHTVASLQKSLTFANHEGDAALCSVVDILKTAGYHTLVLSNQPWLGIHETASSRLLDNAHEVEHFNISNTDGFYQVALQDEVVLPSFERAVRSSGNIAILVHLMGSHSPYRMRSPSGMKRFSDTPPAARFHALHADQIRDINDYDASIVCTDALLDRMIGCLEAVGRPSALVYFSDHGDAVYEDGRTRGHAENAGSRYMFEIPFVIWLSKEYQKERPRFVQTVQAYTRRPWQTDDLIYPLLDLAGVTFDGINHAKNILSPAFVREKRPMGDKEYDMLYK